MTKEKVVCYYHNDMDGMASAAVVLKVYPQAKLIKVNYGDDWDVNDVIDSTCIVVDFSFPNMEEMKQYADIFCWNDHHKSAMENQKKLWDNESIDGLRQLDKSGCELTWEWFCPHESIPTIIAHIGDRDLWKFEMEGTKEISEALHYRIKEPKDLIKCLDDDGSLLHSLIETGTILHDRKMQQVKKSFSEGSKCKLWVRAAKTGYMKSFICNSAENSSDIGNYACEQGYDVGVVWSIKRNIAVVSLRSIKDNVDVSIIAKEFGGGGHKHAAGFSIEKEKLWDVIEVEE